MKRHNLHHLLLPLIIILLLISTFQTSANPNEKNHYRFRTLSSKGGFYYDGVKAIQQDKDGFIWILMDNDIQRFDGYEYKHYYNIFKNTDNSKKWDFHGLHTNIDGILHVSTSNGVYRYNDITDSFDCIIKENLPNMYINKSNAIWAVERNRLIKYNEAGASFDSLYYKSKLVNHIRTFSGNKKYTFMATLYDRIYFYDNEQGADSVSLLYKFPQYYSIALIKCTEDKLWALVANKGLFKIDISTKTVEDSIDIYHMVNEEKLPIKTFHIDKNKQIWLGTQRGLFIINPETKKYQKYQHSKSDIFSLPNNSVWTISEDSQRNIWLGTFSGGLCYVNLDENILFKTYTPYETPLSHNLVSGLAEDDRYLWIATEGGGLNCMNKQTGEFTLYKHRANSNSISYDNVKSLALDSKNNLWISMYLGGLDYFDTKKNQFTHYRYTASNKSGLLSNNLRKIVIDGNDGLWIAYQLNKTVISYYSFKDKTFTHYTLDEENSSFYIFDIYKGKDNYLWAITDQKLYQINGESHTIKAAPWNNEFHMNGRSIYADQDGNVWIGTIGNGIIKYDGKTSKFTVSGNIPEFDILTIYSICADDKDFLWLGTNNGLFRYDPKNNSYLRFDENDGLQGQVYYPLSCIKSKNGDLYFGGTNGFTMIDPRNIKSNQYKPRVIIADFLIDNVPASADFKSNTSVYQKDRITLNHSQSNFGFTFSSDNYLMSNKNQFKYRLKGYDNRWITVNARNRTALYSKVPPGTYHFEVLASNNDGLWSDTPTTIEIERLPSPWLSWKAYILYSIIILTVLGLFIYYYNEKKKLKFQLYLDDLDKQKKEEIHQSQLRFFTNISHDFRTPLSLILATLDNLKQEGLKEYYHKILINNAKRLLNLVNELMDFRTVENGKMQLQVEPLDINRLVEELSYDFNDYAKKRNIQFSIEYDRTIPQLVYVDKQIVEKVIMNLLNNAFKYTKDGGQVTIETRSSDNKFISYYTNSFTVKDNNLENSFSIIIKDSGIGISKESIASVFERFYKVKTVNLDSHLGTGIGLALVKSLVLLHKGAITIYSERDKGTDMIVQLSTDPSIYQESEFIKNDNEAIPNEAPSIEENTIEDTIGASATMNDVFLREQKRILIVEDNDDLRSLISNFLSIHFDIKEAENGVRASEILYDTDIDLIISDIMMPLKDGVTLCKEVKNDMNTSHIPFILLTAKTELETKLESAGSGADIYFEKPIDFNLLLLTIQNVFKQQQKLREFYSKNYFVDSAELSVNEQDNNFLKKFIAIIDSNIDQPNIDVNYIAAELSMSRSKLYSKVKTLTDKSIVEFILNYKLRKAARLIIEQDMSVGQVMEKIGIKSQSYFTSVFKKEFGEPPATFAAKHRKRRD